jgi:hypothetical protein
MRNTHDGVANFELARRKAVEIIKAQKESASIQILTASCFGHEQRLLTKADALQYVSDLSIVAASPTWNSVFQKQKDVLELAHATNAYCYYLSDFQDANFNGAPFANDTTIHALAIPFVANSKANISVDSCWLQQPIQMRDQQTALLVRLRNFGDAPVENVRLSLSLNGEQKYVGAVSIPALTEKLDTIPFSVHQIGASKGVVHINDEPINFDNDYYFTVNVKSNFEVYCLAQNPSVSPFKALAAGFKNTHFTFSDYNHINYNQMDQADVIVLQDAEMLNGGVEALIEKRINMRGLSLIVFPSDKHAEGLNTYLSKLKVQLGAMYSPGNLKAVNTQAPFFKDMFRKTDESMEMPTIKNAYKLQTEVSSGVQISPILETKEDADIVVAMQKGGLSLFLFTFPLQGENTNFASKALFAPMLAKMMLSSTDRMPLAYDLGASRSIELPYYSAANEAAFHLKSANADIIPEQRIVEQSLFINVHNQLTQPGWYSLGEKAQEQVLAFNFSRKESTPVDLQQAENWAKNVHASLVAASVANAGVLAKQVQEGIHYWQMLIVLALLLILLEVVFLRFWR